MFGDANDYVGKGLSGGTIVVRPMTASPLITNQNTIVGNTVLYGATAVVEGAGSNACEYMTSGTVVIVGDFGRNLAAGMTGGMAFVYDPDGSFPIHVNADTVVWQRIENPYWEAVVRGLVEEHVAQTQSRRSCAPRSARRPIRRRRSHRP